jgi:hypothetical protein
VGQHVRLGQMGCRVLWPTIVGLPGSRESGPGRPGAPWVYSCTRGLQLETGNLIIGSKNRPGYTAQAEGLAIQPHP